MRYVLVSPDNVSTIKECRPQREPYVLNGLRLFQEYGSALSHIYGKSILCIGVDPTIVELLRSEGFEVRIQNEDLASVPDYSWDTVLCCPIQDSEVDDAKRIASHRTIVLSPDKPLYVDGESIKLMTSVPLLSAEQTFYSVDPLVDWAKPFLKDGIAVEVNGNGLRALLHKQGGKVSIYFEEQLRDRASDTLTLARSVQALSVDEALISCHVSLWKSGSPATRKENGILVAEGARACTLAVRAICNDLLWLEGRDLHSLPWSERHTLLKGLGLEDPLYLGESRVVHSVDALQSAISTVSKVKGSEGAILKHTESEYNLSGQTIEWARLKTILEVRTLVLAKKRAGDTWTYVAGYSAEGKIIRIGKTFNTRLNVSVGSIISVSVESITVDADGLLSWEIPRVLDCVHYRQRPDTVESIVANAWSAKRMIEYTVSEL